MGEYSMMVQTMQLQPGMSDATGEEVGKSLAVALGQIVKTVSTASQKLEGGGWEIVSHELTRIDRHLVVSFLLRRGT